MDLDIPINIDRVDRKDLKLSSLYSNIPTDRVILMVSAEFLINFPDIMKVSCNYNLIM